MLHEEHMLKSGRVRGAVGSKMTAVSQWVLENLTPDEAGEVLDFGAGEYAQQTRLLSEAGYTVSAHELEGNRETAVHITDRGFNMCPWDTVLMSNVINVQEGVTTAARLAVECLRHANKMLVFNLPNSPCYWMTNDTPALRLLEFEHTMEEVGVLIAGTMRYSGGHIYVFRKV